jgi:FkbM family methyltransferase
VLLQSTNKKYHLKAMAQHTYVSYESGCGKLACVNENEASFLLQKIFIEEEYGHLDYGCGNHIVDVGGNIGVFAKYAAFRSGGEDTTVWSFEPMPPLFKCLQANVRNTDKVYNLGVGHTGTVRMDYLPNYTLLSGYHASHNQTNYEQAAKNNSVDVNVDHAFKSTQYDVDIVTLSTALKPILESDDMIAILKIDVEGMEKDVVDTISDELWVRIHQVVIEVHEEGDRISYIEKLLQSKGFDVSRGELAPPCFLLGEDICADDINACLVTGIKKRI